MEELVADLLYLARSDAGSQAMRLEPVDLDDLLLAAAERHDGGGSIRMDVTGVSGGQVVGDKPQLRRLIGNLAGNAVRYATSVVRFSLHEETDSVVLTVADDGPGIDGGDRERIFERFARADEGRSRDDGGSGLGLAIARDIVVRHAGSIEVDSDYAPGTRFVVRFPRGVTSRL